jgi:hypothetical protein
VVHLNSAFLDVELTFEGGSHPNPYLATVDVVFEREGQSVTRPAFWRGGTTFCVRFNPPVACDWKWRTVGLPGGEKSGQISATESTELLRMSPKGRNFVWSSGTPYFPVCDTAWSLPWRATLDETKEYISDRKAKGFSGALLMTVQPDMRAEGPSDPTAKDGFMRGFHDLKDGHLIELNPEFFEQLDAKIKLLLRGGIVPFHTPLFFGFGWKGLNVIGPKAVTEEAVRFVRYLFARYGAWPGIWIVGADGTGNESAVEAMGRWLDENDDANQPRGIHYNPWQSCEAHWNEDWCHFHLCQTGHDGKHLPDRVTHMSSRSPIRGVGNGEPTYEGMDDGKAGKGEWQMTEAWSNLVAGGTLGVWYGAASLWQWKRERETAWGSWSSAPWDWREALTQPGSHYPGLVAKALQGYDFADMRVSLTVGHNRQAVANPGKFAAIWLPDGGNVTIETWGDNVPWRALCAKTLEVLAEGKFSKNEKNWYMGEEIGLPVGRPIIVLSGHRR